MRNNTHEPLHTQLPVRSGIYCLVFLFFFTFVNNVAKTQTYTPVAVTGFTDDIIANGSTFAGSVTNTVDAPGGYYFLNQSFTAFGTPTYYLPSSGLLTSTTTTGLTFQLADASQNNSLRLATQNASGTLTFVTPRNAGTVYLVGTSGSGASTIDVAVTFTDATTQIFTGQTIADWYSGTPVVVQGIGRTSATALDNGGGTTNPRLYQLALSLSGSNYFKQIASITITKTNATGSGYTQIMGVSVAAPCAIPTASATALNLTATSTGQINGSFTAAAPAADQYLVVRYSAGSTPTAPVNGITYATGAALGTGTVVQSSATTTFSATGLTGGTAYDFYVYSFNNTNCVGPAYLTSSPLTGTQTTQTCAAIAAGTYTIGTSGTYPTLTALASALNANGTSGNVIFELLPSYSSTGETFPITFTTGACPVVSAVIRPASGATGLSISSSNTTATIDINNFKNLTIDGRPGGTGTASQLSIVNINTSGVAIRFVNDAQNNTITYCDVQGQNTSSTSSTTANSGVICFGGTTTAALLGNDNNTISNCSIHSVGASLPTMGISSTGTTATAASYNDNNTITNNNIYDYFNATTASTGVKLDAGNSAWTISNNSLYQTATRTVTTAGVTHRGLWVTPNGGSLAPQASGFVITGNYIGGNAPNAGSGPYTVTSTTTAVFLGMDLSVGLGTATSVQNNTIQNISFTTTSTANPMFAGISMANGHVNIGTVTGNTIGSATGTGSILITNTSSSTGTSWGIRVGGGTSTTTDCRNNNIASITIAGSATILTNFIGIGANAGSTTNLTINNNVIGSTTTANSINLTTASTGAGSVTGIAVTSGASTVTISGNTIANLNSNSSATGSTTALVRGINVSVGAPVITNNLIRNLSNANATTSTGGSSAVAGIIMSSTTTPAVITGNIIHSLSLTGSSTTAASQITGLFYNGGTNTANIINRNFIHSFDVTAVNTSATITGMDIGGGGSTFTNNMIRLGIRPDGSSLATALTVRGMALGTTTANNFYFNSIYIGGTGVGTVTAPSFAFYRSATSGTFEIRNNIFVNVRSNATTGGKHYAVYFSATTTGVNVDYNIYQYSGTGGLFAFNGTADVAAYTPGWVASDVHSYAQDPFFANPTGTSASVDLHLQTGSIAEGTGIDIPSITDDFDGQVRSTLSPVDIGADAGNYGYSGVDVGATLLVAPATGNCFSATQPVIIRIKNFSTNTINFSTNNVTVSAAATGAATYSSSTVLNTGSLAPGATMDVTLPASINMSANGTYTFTGSATATGDLNGNNNNIATTAIVYQQLLGGTYTVGASGNYPTLTAAVAAYNAATCITGPVVFSLIDASYTTNETFPIIINANGAASTTNTLTIKPATGMSPTISGSVSSGGLIRLNGADYVTIDGSNNGTTSQNLTVTNTATTAPTAIALISLGTGAGATNNTIKNINISTGLATSTGYGVAIGGSTPGTSGADNDNNTIQNNNITVATVGIYANGTAAVSAGGMDNLVINKNSVTSSTSNTLSNTLGIQVGNGLNGSIAGNTLDIFTSASGQPVGISLETGFVSSSVTNNKIIRVVTTATGGYGGRGITVGTGTTSSNLTIANNFIAGVNGSNWSGFTNSSSMGIAVGVVGISTSLSTTTGGVNIYYNTVNMYGPYSYATNCNTAAIYIGSAGSFLDIRNNIFVNSMNNTNGSGTGSKNYAIYSAAANTAFTAINYNDYYVSGTQGVLAYLGGDQATLAALQSAFGQNLNSKNIQPFFFSNTDLHLLPGLNASLNNLGTPISGITTDIDGDPRDAATPDMGADEFTPPNVDAALITFVTPGVQSCYSNAQTVSVRIRNLASQTLDFSVSPTVVAVQVSGAATSTLSQNLTSGTILPGDSLLVTFATPLNMTTVGVYNFKSYVTAPGDANVTNDTLFNTTRTLVAPVAGTVTASSGQICVSGTPTLTLSGNAGGAIQWQQSSSATGPWTNVGTGTNTYTPAAAITSSTYYRAYVSCNANADTSAALQVVVNNPQLLSVTPGQRCGPGQVVLTATPSAGATINWYDAPTGGNLVGTGNLFFTPVINTNTTYYAAAANGGGASNVGLSPTASNCGTIGSSTLTDWPLRFNTTTAVTINSAYVIPATTGTFTVALRNSLSGTDIQTASFNFTTADIGIPKQINLGFVISTPGSYQLTNTVGGGYRIGTYTCTYPYTSANGGLSIVGSATTSTSTTNTNTYNIFFQLSVSEGCESPRQAVQAVVNPGPAFTVTTSRAVCNGAITALTVTSPQSNYNTYQWSPATGLFTDPAATIPYVAGTSATTVYFKNTTVGTYTYVANANNNTTTCTGIDSTKITVLPAAVTLSASPAQICVSGSTTITSLTSGFGNASFQWYSSPNGTTYTAITGATQAFYTTPTITATTYYKVDIKDGAGNVCQSPTITVVVNSPQVLTTTPAAQCGPGSLTLQATGSAGTTLNWYNSSGVLVGTGTSFTTPALTATTTYFVGATAGGTSGSVGPLYTGTSTNGTNVGSHGIALTTTAPVTINSAQIAFTGTGTFTISLKNTANTTVISSVTTATVTGSGTTAVTVPIGLTISTPGSYLLIVDGVSGSIGALGYSSGNAYPYTALNNAISITSGYWYGTDASNNMYLFNLNVSSGCESPRVAVNATINTNAAVTTQPQAQTVCQGSTVVLSVGATGSGLTYQWRKGGSNINGATSASYAINNAQPTDGGNYDVVITGTCSNVTSAVAAVVVNATGTWLGVTNSDWNTGSNWCGSVPSATTDVIIPAGTPYAPVIGNYVANARNVTINNGASLTTTGGAQFNIYGNYSNSGTLTSTAGFIFFRGTTNQSVSALTAANVFVNGTGGITLTGNMNATTLVLQSGNITLGTNNLTTTGSVNGTVASHIITNGSGKVTSNAIGAGPVIIPVGPDAANYNPVMIANGQGTSYTVNVATSITPSIANNNYAVNRTWTITPGAAVAANVAVTLQYADAHGNSLFVPNAPVEIGRYNGTNWLVMTPSNGVTPLGAATERQVTLNTNQFGSFVVSSPGGIGYLTSVPTVTTDVQRILLMPNPVQDRSVLRVVVRRAMKISFKVIDASGKSVMLFNSSLTAGTNDLSIDLSRLSGGVYMITGMADNGRTEVVRFIKL